MIAVIMPCYKVKKHVLDVLKNMGPEVGLIYVVDDACPEYTANFVQQYCTDERVHVIRNPQNLGVGGAVMVGYQAAIADGAKIMVKVDGDGQMAPSIIPRMVAPILAGKADYTKGNRFFDLDALRAMPKMRLFGNAVLSLMTKLSTGYWHLFDPTNGYTAIHTNVAKHVRFNKISPRYFFETDMLFRLNILRAVVIDVPMSAQYGDEVSNLKISKIIGEFFFKHIRNCWKRIFYNYYLRDMSLASIELPAGLFLFGFGVCFGGYQWAHFAKLNVSTPTGTVMIATLSILMGFQLLMAFLNYDINAACRYPKHKALEE
ncbi:MAG: glycosyltransferase family 2 protein [Legionellaceae bacterium]|nr:glycosyltransferase family 2 protein [Legionellaceae bacterium]